MDDASILIFNSDNGRKGFVDGKMDLGSTKMVCVPSKEKYAEVDLCLKTSDDKGWNLQVAAIVGGCLSFEEKKKLGYEIEKRWNAYKGETL